MDLSNPMSLALNAGTAQSSAVSKSHSLMPYFSLRICMIASLTLSFTLSSSYGQDPSRRLSCSPSTTSDAFFLIWFWARWGSRSVMRKEGSSSFSPILILTVFPSDVWTTPLMESGMVVHWYFLMPP